MSNEQLSVWCNAYISGCTYLRTNIYELNIWLSLIDNDPCNRLQEVGISKSIIFFPAHGHCFSFGTAQGNWWIVSGAHDPFTPDTNVDFMTWTYSSPLTSAKIRGQQSAKKLMATVFWDVKQVFVKQLMQFNPVKRWTDGGKLSVERDEDVCIMLSSCCTETLPIRRKAGSSDLVGIFCRIHRLVAWLLISF